MQPITFRLNRDRCIRFTAYFIAQEQLIAAHCQQFQTLQHNFQGSSPLAIQPSFGQLSPSLISQLFSKSDYVVDTQILFSSD